MKTLQELYDNAKARISKHGRSTIGDAASTCAYRGANGAACAVGANIDDPVYDPCIEGFAVGAVAPYDGVWKPRQDSVVTDREAAMARAFNESGIPATTVAFRLLQDLQGAHDGAANTIDALTKMADVAARNNLNP